MNKKCQIILTLFAIVIVKFFINYPVDVVFIGKINSIDSEGIQNIDCINSLKRKYHNVYLCPTDYNCMDILESDPYHFTKKQAKMARFLFMTILKPKKIIIADDTFIMGNKYKILLNSLKLKSSEKIAIIEKSLISLKKEQVAKWSTFIDSIVVQDEELKNSLNKEGWGKNLIMCSRKLNLNPIQGYSLKKSPGEIFVFTVFVTNDYKYREGILNVIRDFYELFSCRYDVVLRIHVKSIKKNTLNKEILAYINSLSSQNIFYTETLMTGKAFHDMLSYSDCYINLGSRDSLNALKCSALKIPVLNYSEQSGSKNLKQVVKDIYFQYYDYFERQENFVSKSINDHESLIKWLEKI